MIEELDRNDRGRRRRRRRVKGGYHHRERERDMKRTHTKQHRLIWRFEEAVAV